MMADEFADAKDWTDVAEGVMRFSMSLSELEGPLRDALPKLQRVLQIDPDAQIVDHGDDGYYHKVCWKRAITASEIAEHSTREAGWAEERVAAERREYERLKAIYEPVSLKEASDE